jgi:pheromone shutdown protein TraB
LGTAHISSSSAILAGKMVREIKPNVVFVELDQKRVARAGIVAGRNNANSSAVLSQSTPPESSSTATAVAKTETESTTPSTSSVISTPTVEKRNMQGISNPFVNLGSRYVGDAVKGMYGKLESEGFKAGDEFVMSVREGLAIGSTIVLGDRDVEVTLKRLTQALTKTDLRKLLSSDSEIEKSMEGLLPQEMKNQISSGSSDSITMGVDDATFNSFVETMKAKENVKTIMTALKKTAPEIYDAMVAERDVYMARGLDELGMNVKNGSVEKTVAVMGMAHVDGVERYLATNGWKEMSYPCSAIKDNI